MILGFGAGDSTYCTAPESKSGISPKTDVKVEIRGFEPLTPGLQSRCSSQLSYIPMLSLLNLKD